MTFYCALQVCSSNSFIVARLDFIVIDCVLTPVWTSCVLHSPSALHARVIMRSSPSILCPAFICLSNMVSRLFTGHIAASRVQRSATSPPSPYSGLAEDEVESDGEEICSTPVKRRWQACEARSSTKQKALSLTQDAPSPRAAGKIASTPPRKRSTRGAPSSSGIAQAHPAVSSVQPPAKTRATRGTACTFKGRRPPKCPERLAAHMLEFEQHKSDVKQRAEERKAARAHKTPKELTPNQQEYKRHFAMQMTSRAGNPRERLKRAAAAWKVRHESLRAAAQ